MNVANVDQSGEVIQQVIENVEMHGRRNIRRRRKNKPTKNMYWQYSCMFAWQNIQPNIYLYACCIPTLHWILWSEYIQYQMLINRCYLLTTFVKIVNETGEKNLFFFSLMLYHFLSPIHPSHFLLFSMCVCVCVLSLLVSPNNFSSHRLNHICNAYKLKSIWKLPNILHISSNTWARKGQINAHTNSLQYDETRKYVQVRKSNE